MRDLIQLLLSHHDILLVSLEKSGAFVDHANEVSKKMANGTALLLRNDYIYRYIIPGDSDPKKPYGSSTNYGHKVIFKTPLGQMHVVSIPCSEIKATPNVEDLANFH